MNASDYRKIMGEISPSDLLCRCCGSRVSALSSPKESICNFCESYVRLEDKNIIHGSSDVEQKLMKMQECASQNKWPDGAASADALGATKDPHFMFGASSFYRFFSDYVYNDVNYELSGFMYPNAEKRSDEPQKNKQNAMSLISKSREYLFRTIKVITDSKSDDEALLFLLFMSNMKLKRHAQAKKVLERLNAPTSNPLIKDYSNMVYGVHTNARGADKYADLSLSHGVPNSLYYLSRHMASKQPGRAISILGALNEKVNMPEAFYFSKTLSDIIASSRL